MLRTNVLAVQRWATALVLAVMLLATPPALAQQVSVPNTAAPFTGAQTPVPLPMWQRTLYKTITYQTVLNAADLVLFELLIGGGTVVTAGFFATNALSAAALYYAFEYAWRTHGPTLDQTTERTLVEKTLLYQAVNSGRYFALGYGFGGGAAIATTFTVVNFVADTAIFAVNEYAWDILRPQQAP